MLNTIDNSSQIVSILFLNIIWEAREAKPILKQN